MSERSFIARVAVRAGYSHEAAEELVQRALDEHAHELAEKIREEARQYGWEDGEAMKLAAKLIDPEERDS